MNVPNLIRATALCAIASAPAHAYFIDIYPSETVGRNATHAFDSVAPKSSKTDGRDATLSLQPIEESLISKLGFSSQATQDRHSFVSENSGGADAFNSAWIGQKSRRNLVDSKKAPLAQSDNYLQVTGGKADLNNSLVIELLDAEESSAGKTTPAVKSPDQNDWADNKIWHDEIQKVALLDNPNAPSTVHASVPEPASPGMLVLGLSALALSRQRAHRMNA